MTRALTAPRELAFDACSQPAHVARWWGPDGFTAPECEIDLRPGGALRIRMVGHGFDAVLHGAFVEIDRPTRLVFDSILRDVDGEIYLEMRNTLTFSASAGASVLDLSVRVLNARPGSEGPLEGMETGWAESLEKLAGYVAEIAAG